jgi:NitT/TauT family transport system substrate-binding protein
MEWPASVRRAGVGLLSILLAVGCAAPSAPAAPPRSPSEPPTASGAAASSPPSGASSPGQAAGARALAPLPSPARVRVGSMGSLSDGPVYIAVERGYFTEVSLDVEDLRFDASTRMMQPLAAGQLDVVSAAITAGLFNAFARDIDVRMVADRALLTPGFGYSGLVVRKDLWDSGAIRTLADLRGRKVGLAGFQAGSSVTMLLGHAMEARGLSLDILEPVDLPLPDTNAALAGGSLDAAMQIEPLVALGLSSGLFEMMHRSDELFPDQQNGFILYAAEFARTQPEAGRRWMVAYLRAVRDYLDALVRDRGYDEVVAILTRNTPVRDAALYRQMVPTYIDPNGRLNVATLAEAQDWYIAHGYIPQKASVEALIDYQFADYAVSVLGEYR